MTGPKPPPDVDELARRLPRHAPGPERTEAIRRALLDAAGPAPRAARPMRRWLVAGGAAAAAAVCAVLAMRALTGAPSDPPGAQSAARTADPSRTADRSRTAGADRAAARAIGSAAATESARTTGAPPGSAVPPGDPIPDGVTAIAATRPVHLSRGSTSITAPPGARFEVDVRGDQVYLVTVTAGWVVIASAHATAAVVVEHQTWLLDAPLAPAAAPPPQRAPSAPGALDAPGGTPSPPPSPPAAITASRTSPPASPRAADGNPPSPAGATSGTSGTSPPASPRAADGHAASPAGAAPTPRSAPSRSGPPAAPRDRSPAEPLRPGEWSPPSLSATVRSPVLPAEPPPRTPPATPALPSATPAVPSALAAAERAFRDGLHALLAGDVQAATAPLDRACGAATSTQDEACYWAAVAWLRVEDNAQASRRLGDLLARWPRSSHAGEASVALGWLLLEAGDRAAARARFAAAANDPLPSVRAEAVRGLGVAQ